MRLICSTGALVLAALAFTVAPAGSSPSVRFGFQDDAWLASGAGTLESRLDLLDRLGVSTVRFRLRWDQIARRRPSDSRRPTDAAYEWEPAASVLAGLRFDDTEIGRESAYTITAFEIAARSQSSVHELPLPGAFSWPVRSVPLAQAHACTPITGPDATVLRRALRAASTFTRWTDDGVDYVLSTRPVLSGEAPCP